MSIDFAVFHYEINVFQRAHIVQRISIDSNDISICARFYDADLSVAIEQFCIDRGGTLDRLHGRQVPFVLASCPGRRLRYAVISRGCVKTAWAMRRFQWI